MTIDHVRDFFSRTQSSGPDGRSQRRSAVVPYALDHTFRAPVFVLCGHQCGTHDGSQTARRAHQFLFKRGLWLLSVEVAIVSTAMSFSPSALKMGGKTAWCCKIYAIGVG